MKMSYFMLWSAAALVRANMGLGSVKKIYQEKEHGAAFEIMKQIKKTLDPNNLLNPIKLLIEYRRKIYESYWRN